MNTDDWKPGASDTNAPHPDDRAAWLRALPADRTPDDELRRASASGISILFRTDPTFPAPLLTGICPPRFLYRRGVAERPCPTVAVVGSRRSSRAGERLAFRIGKELGEAGVRVVSGLARGIDRAVLDGAVAGEGRPVAILGNGLPAIYPPENADLARRIVDGGGTLYCELPLDAPPRRRHFPRRNRLISALAGAVLVVEATLRSGSLITAGWALEQGKEVLAVPGPVEGPGHEGCHQLIRDGAHLVTCTEDVLEVLSGVAPRPPDVPASLREAFRGGERDLGRLQEISGLPAARLLEAWRTLRQGDPPSADDSPVLS